MFGIWLETMIIFLKSVQIMKDIIQGMIIMMIKMVVNQSLAKRIILLFSKVKCKYNAVNKDWINNNRNIHSRIYFCWKIIKLQ